ncbi:helix-turn-helix domain-containing protein [Thermomonospora umbrina]|uniref:Helix-turn-helix protein n=1 Tax=Thermomonospora umbrina TaxID=111806 RepID=A0A3D9ST15_9ACTN|nr:helix-turn-helix domain-containing protein [Thermomonospora umbrina]REE97143.1 helix-turn-helix protein [Thermomonospora umbrina]
MAVERAPESVGVRIARVRKRRGMTQLGLAQRANYSRSHIAQVEAGHKLATPAFVAAVAATLGVDTSQLYGQPFHGRSDDDVQGSIPEIRRALVFTDVPPESAVPSRSLNVLAAELATIRRLQMASRHAHIGMRLPALLEELAWYAHDGDDPRVWALLFTAHEAAADLSRKLGYHDLADGCLERAERAARRAQDPHLSLLVALRRSLLLLAVAQWRPALALLHKVTRDVDPEREDAAEILGTAHLRAAIVAARSGDDTSAWDHYGEAVQTQDEGGWAPGDRHGVTTGFVPGNVAIHGAAVAVELGDLEEAARRDRQVTERTLATLVPERRAHHAIDMARVHTETGDHDRALERLLSAERTAPQMTHFHPSARTVTAHLVDVRRTLPEPLRKLHTRMGL